jgi:hypothetical protein
MVVQLQTRRRFVQLVGGAALSGTVVLVDACTTASNATPRSAPVTAAAPQPTSASSAPTPTIVTGPTTAPATASAAPTVAPTAAVSSASKLPLPGYFPVPNMPAADLPASADGLIPPGFVAFPKDGVFTSVPTPTRRRQHRLRQRR